MKTVVPVCPPDPGKVRGVEETGKANDGVEILNEQLLARPG